MQSYIKLNIRYRYLDFANHMKKQKIIMRFKDEFQETITSKFAEVLGILFATIVIYLLTQIAVLLFSLINSVFSNKVLIPLFFISLLLNIFVLVWLWKIKQKPEFILRYGVYWDHEKNPHCPLCKKPIGSYDSTRKPPSYTCKSCGNFIRITNQVGNDIPPSKVIAEL